jgi:hypothetical protein
MSFLGRQSATDMANFKFSRRELPAKLFAIGAALLLPERQKVLVSQTEVQPKFKIGDFIASDWVDEFDQDSTDFGEIMGMRWVARPDSFSSSPKTWVYFVRWTRTTNGADSAYPCYDGEPTRECDLRLVSAEEVCKPSAGTEGSPTYGHLVNRLSLPNIM